MLLQAGQLEVTYDNGFLRYFTIAGQEVLRMIYFAVRDRDWNTVPGSILNEKISSTENSFSIGYQFYVNEGEIQMLWEVKINGLPDSRIVFDIHGKVLYPFLKNRLGFCVLHPIDGISGRPCLVEHSDGTTSQTFFPAHIHPYQPFRDIRSMQWQSIDGATLHLAFEGEVFETEDHRNWTDSSYKTYCTPLDLPFPVEVHPGTEIHQVCTLQVANAGAKVSNSGISLPITIGLTTHTQPFPGIGIGLNPETEKLSAEEILFLKKAGFSHLRADVFLNQEDWQQRVQKAIRQSKELEIPLELALFFGENPAVEVLQLLSWLTGSSATISQMLLFKASDRLSSTDLLKKVVPAIRLAMPGCKLGGGTDANFAELNRHIFDYKLLDFVSYSANPQVHASDNLTLVENMSAQGETVLSAKRLTDGKMVHISPVTLKPRFNAVATSGNSNTLPPADNRQSTDFIAGWTLGSLKYSSEAGVSSLTYFETTGIRGICSGTAIYPAGKLFEFILTKKPVRVRISNSSHPLKVSSLVLESNDAAYLLLANHTPNAEVVVLPDFIQIATRYVVLSQENSPSEVDNTVSLQPYAIVALQINTGSSGLN